MNTRKMAIMFAIREAERMVGEDGEEFVCAKAIDLLEADQDGPEAVEVLKVHAEMHSVGHCLPYISKEMAAQIREFAKKSL